MYYYIFPPAHCAPPAVVSNKAALKLVPSLLGLPSMSTGPPLLRETPDQELVFAGFQTLPPPPN